MPIDPSIYNMVGKFPQIEVPDPLERQTRLAQLKQLANQGQMTDMAMADAQAKRARDARAKDLLTKNQGDIQKAAQEAAAAGDYETASEFQTLIKSRAQTDAVYQKSVAEWNEAKAKLTKAERENVLAGLQDMSKGIQWVKEVGPEERPARWATFVRAYPPEVREKYGLGGEYNEDAAGFIMARARAVNDDVNEGSGFHPAIGPDGRPGIFQVTKKGEARQIQGIKPIPTTHSAPSGYNPVANPNQPVSDPNDSLSKLPENDQAIVRQLATRQLMVGRAGGFQLNNARNQALYGMAVRLNPSLSVVDNAAYQDFVKDLAKSSANSAGGRVDSGNRLLGHSAELIDALKELKPGSGTMGRIGNVISYPTDKAFGESMGKVSFIKSKVLAEVNKLVTGGVPHAKELEDDIKNLPDTATKEQWGSIIKAIADVGLEQVTATEEKRNNFLGSMAPKTSLLSEKAQKALAKVYKYAGVATPDLQPSSGTGYTETARQGNPQASKVAPAAQAKILSEAEIGKLPPAVASAYKSGKAIKGPDGTVYKKGE